MSAAVTIAAALSTVEPRLANLDRLWDRSAGEVNRLDEVVVVVQQARDPDIRQRVADAAVDGGVACPVRVVLDEGVGLSRSRNMALAAVRSDYAWLLDDDVELVSGAVAETRRFMEAHAADVYCGRVQRLDDDMPYKRYRPMGVLRRLELLRVSSIEMVIATRLARRGLAFRESLGLGARFPAGEEAVFLLDAHDAGGVVMHMPVAVARHPMDGRSFQNGWRNPARLMAQGIVARRVGGPAGLAVLTRWGWRLVRAGLPARLLLPLASGFLRGRTLL